MPTALHQLQPPRCAMEHGGSIERPDSSNNCQPWIQCNSNRRPVGSWESFPRITQSSRTASAINGIQDSIRHTESQRCLNHKPVATWRLRTQQKGSVQVGAVAYEADCIPTSSLECFNPSGGKHWQHSIASVFGSPWLMQFPSG